MVAQPDGSIFYSYQSSLDQSVLGIICHVAPVFSQWTDLSIADRQTETVKRTAYIRDQQATVFC